LFIDSAGAVVFFADADSVTGQVSVSPSERDWEPAKVVEDPFPNFLIDDLRSSLHLRPVCWRVAELRPLVTLEPLEIEPKRKKGVFASLLLAP
jgi:hypothetical protein